MSPFKHFHTLIYTPLGLLANQEENISLLFLESNDVKRETSEKTWFFEGEDKDFIPPPTAEAE